MRVIIYARVSTEDQMEKYGIPTQLRACRDYAKAQGWEVILEIVDEGVSGVILDRPGLTRLRDLVRAGGCEVILMLDVDRLSRELTHLLILKPEIEKRARLEFVAAKFEDSPTGRLFFNIRGVIASYERELTCQRTSRGRRERAISGLIVGGRTAYGYRYEKGCLIADEKRARVVRDIFAWFAAGDYLRAITRKLRESGAPTWGGKLWGKTSVRRILANETYAGLAHFGTHRREGKMLRVREDQSNRIALVVPALVSRELWDRCQLRLASNCEERPGRPSRSSLLGGLLYCQCGRRMHSDRSRSNRASYRCSSRDLTGAISGKCGHGGVSVSRLDQGLWRELLRAFTDARFLREILTAHEAEARERGPEALDELRSQVKRNRRREEAALAMLLDPDLASDRGTIKTQYAKAQAERKTAEAAIARLEVTARQALDVGAWLEEAIGLLREYLPSIELMEDRRRFVAGAVSRVVWDGAAAQVDCRFSAEMAPSSGRSDRLSTVEFTLTVRLAA